MFIFGLFISFGAKSNLSELKPVKDTERTSLYSIDVGVPQGSSLGPLLFLIYINDLPQAVQNSTVSMYADDTSLCYQSSDINELNEAINNDLKQLDSWLQGNKLSLNVAKTNSMLVFTKQQHNILKSRNEDLDLKIRDNEVEIIQKTKYLGVQIDNSLTHKDCLYHGGGALP